MPSCPFSSFIAFFVPFLDVIYTNLGKIARLRYDAHFKILCHLLETQKNYLRGIAHSKNPIVSIGNKGLTEAVLNEIEIALEHHEILKIKLPGTSKSEKTSLLELISQTNEKSGCSINWKHRCCVSKL